MAEDRQDRNNLDGDWYPKMGRVRGLLQAINRIRNQQNPPSPGRGPRLPQIGRERGFPPPSPP